jgi:hypothetical protein
VANYVSPYNYPISVLEVFQVLMYFSPPGSLLFPEKEAKSVVLLRRMFVEPINITPTSEHTIPFDMIASYQT